MGMGGGSKGRESGVFEESSSDSEEERRERSERVATARRAVCSVSGADSRGGRQGTPRPRGSSVFEYFEYFELEN